MKYSYETHFEKVTLDLTDEKKDLIVATVLQFFEECGGWHGEVLAQSDALYERAYVFAELADELGFEVEWKD